jgi:hypothetical protein
MRGRRRELDVLRLCKDGGEEEHDATAVGVTSGSDGCVWWFFSGACERRDTIAHSANGIEEGGHRGVGGGELICGR